MSLFKDWSHSLRRMFVKDMSLPISLVEDPYFSHQMHSLDRQYHTLEKAELLSEALCAYKNSDEFMSDMRKTRERMIDHVKGSPLYDKFKGFSAGSTKVPQRSMYKQDFCGKDLISLDMVSANFQCFKKFAPALVDNCDTYRDFAKQFTDVEYFLKSKQLRQIVFGNLNPKAQQTLMKQSMYEISRRLVDSNQLSLSADEIVLESPHGKTYFDKFADDNKKDFELTVSEFKIERLKTSVSSIYIKRHTDGTFDLKCCPSNYVLEVLRHIYGEPLHPYDRIFYSDGRICEYKDTIIQ